MSPVTSALNCESAGIVKYPDFSVAIQVPVSLLSSCAHFLEESACVDRQVTISDQGTRRQQQQWQEDALRGGCEPQPARQVSPHVHTDLTGQDGLWLSSSISWYSSGCRTHPHSIPGCIPEVERSPPPSLVIKYRIVIKYRKDTSLKVNWGL